jgi:hypothetical protein
MIDLDAASAGQLGRPVPRPNPRLRARLTRRRDMPIACGRPTLVASWHLLEQSGKLFVPNSRAKMLNRNAATSPAFDGWCNIMPRACEPLQERKRLVGPILIVPQSREARRSAQFPGERALTARQSSDCPKQSSAAAVALGAACNRTSSPLSRSNSAVSQRASVSSESAIAPRPLRAHRQSARNGPGLRSSERR